MKWWNWLGMLCGLLLLALSIAIAQDKPPKLSVDARLAIREAQLKQKQLEADFLSKQQEITSLQQQMAKLSTQYTEGAKAFQDAIDAAYKDAKIEKKDWNLDMEKLEFTKIAPPPAAPPKPEEPKKP